MRKTKSKISVALIGGSGYAGFEAIRILLRHPAAELVGIYGPAEEVGPITGFYPLLSKTVEMDQQLYDPAQLARRAEVALLCVPHKVAMSYVPALRDAGVRVIDWSADYRLHDRAVYEKWYCPHADAARLAEAVYGLPEYFAEQIASADLIANPGCYPTCASLPLIPVIKAGLIEPTGIVVNAISGVSGAGRKAAPAFHFPHRNENFEPYAPGVHRHMPEMDQVITDTTGIESQVLFVPHLCPMDRGMLCSIYARPTRPVTAEEVVQVLQAAYADAPFVRVRTDILPATRYVSTTNFCDIAARVERGTVMLFSALDNLVKGASGQAIQNMNLMFGLDETTGLY
ncbi:MAG TPA: N-acetyl-gamma-glutamyl-phosphate reductase [Phycisphaerae bacterium]|nr:N-acetyl-gamma-glutamyl-phosphate reductase [Phycisphaerae bacterium]